MKSKQKKAGQPVSSLRKKAESFLKKKMADVNIKPLSAKEAHLLVHELQTHQIELEIQNEELRNAQAALEDAKNRYSDLYDFAPVGYLTLDRKGSVVEANLTGAEMLGVERKKLIRMSFTQFISKGGQDTFYLYRKKISDSGERQRCELEISPKGKAVFSAMLDTVIASGNLCRTVISDISDRKKYEGELKESERKYRSIFEGANDGIIACDLTTLKFLFANKRISALTGYSMKEILKLGVKDLHPDKDLPYVLKEFNKIAAGEITETRNIPVLKKDKSIIYCDIGSSFINKTTLLGFFRDVTDRKNAEEALNRSNYELKKRTAELETVNKELEDFSYTASHDLKAPLRRIEGFAQVILEDYIDKLDETGKDYFHRVVAAAKRMNQLIDALLEIARLTQRELKEESVDLSSIAKVVAYELKKKRPERQVEFIISKGLKARGDEELMKIVIENLLDNAYKFTWKHPSAKIEFGAVSEISQIGLIRPIPQLDKCNPPLHPSQEGTIYFVRDDGSGFDMKFADKLFRPFQHLHSENIFPGLGIGLAIVHKIITRHGGKIWAEAEVEKGATFFFTL